MPQSAVLPVAGPCCRRKLSRTHFGLHQYNPEEVCSLTAQVSGNPRRRLRPTGLGSVLSALQGKSCQPPPLELRLDSSDGWQALPPRETFAEPSLSRSQPAALRCWARGRGHLEGPPAQWLPGAAEPAPALWPPKTISDLRSSNKQPGVWSEVGEGSTAALF